MSQPITPTPPSEPVTVWYRAAIHTQRPVERGVQSFFHCREKATEWVQLMLPTCQPGDTIVLYEATETPIAHYKPLVRPKGEEVGHEPPK